MSPQEACTDSELVTTGYSLSLKTTALKSRKLSIVAKLTERENNSAVQAFLALSGVLLFPLKTYRLALLTK